MHGTSLLGIASELGSDVGLCEESTQQASVLSKVDKREALHGMPHGQWKVVKYSKILCESHNFL